MQAISNAGLANLGKPPVDTSLMTPVVTFVADYGAKTLTLTSATTVTSPETFNHINIIITDADGVSLKSEITTRTGNTGAIDISTLNQVGNINLNVMVTSTLGIICVGSFFGINSTRLTGAVGNYAIEFTTATV